MIQQIINAVVPVVITAAVAVLVAGIKAVGDAAVAYISRKKDAVVAQIGAATYNHNLTIARSIWGAVDEEFRITPTLEKTITAKQELFATKIQKAIPGITEDEIVQLRQAVAGEVNKGREALTAAATSAQSAAVGTVTAPTTPAQQATVQPGSGVVAPATTGAA
jgi:hypothetical protein